MNFEELILKRESVRSFSDKEVEEYKLTKILEAGRIAPTAKNLQPIKIYVINTKDRLKDLDEATKCRYNAQTSLIVCGDKNLEWKNNREFYPSLEVDCSIVATHMMLEATNLGVDSIWVRLFDTNILREKFNIPQNIVPVCLLNLGYRAPEYKTNPLHTTRKSIEEIVEYIKE